MRRGYSKSELAGASNRYIFDAESAVSDLSIHRAGTGPRGDFHVFELRMTDAPAHRNDGIAIPRVCKWKCNFDSRRWTIEYSDPETALKSEPVTCIL